MNPLTNSNQESLEKKWISMSEAALLTPYSAEYLSLRARKGKLASKKINNNWFTTREAIEAYLKKQELRAQMENGSMPMNVVMLDPKALLPQQSPIPLNKLRTYHSDLRDHERRQGGVKESLIPSSVKVFSPVVQNRIPREEAHKQSLEEMKAVMEEVIDKKLLTHSSSNTGNNIPPKKVSKITKSNTSKNSRIFLGGVLVALIIFSTLDSPFVLGVYEKSLGFVKEKWEDAGTILGLLPGVKKNEILLLDKNGNIAITGRVETSDVFRSSIKDGVAPIIVESRTEVKNLNAELLGGVPAGSFTLAFVTSNGNITTE
ncbi:MAG: hypothetical protein WD874_02100, partial [Parcubacteria group bacterium]